MRSEAQGATGRRARSRGAALQLDNAFRFVAVSQLRTRTKLLETAGRAHSADTVESL